MLFLISAVLAFSKVAVGHLQASQQPPSPDTHARIHIDNIFGSVTVKFSSPSSPALRSEDLSNPRLDGFIIFNVVVGTLLIYQSIQAISRWPYEFITGHTQTKSGPPAGRRSAVPEWPEFKVVSPAQRDAHSLDEVVLLTTTPLSGLSLPTEPPVPARSGARSELRPSSRAGPSTEITFWVGSLGPCIHHQRDRSSTQIKKSVIQPKESVSRSYPSIHDVIAGGSSLLGNLGSLSHEDDEPSHLLESPTSHPIFDNNHASLASRLTSLIASHSILALSLLVVGLDWAHDEEYPLPGVAHDIKWFKRICFGFSPIVALQTLTNATHDIIRSKILDMFNDARPGTAVVLYFNGHGLGNSFQLYDDTCVGAALLIEWITKIRQETSKVLPVCIVFDHCRSDMRAPVVVDLGQDIHIIWACMPGQRSADIKMTGGDSDYIPCSNFLKVVALVLDEARNHPTRFVDDLMSRMNFWMELMVRMTRAEECGRHCCPVPCPLCSCLSYDNCTHGDTRLRHSNPLAYPRAQNPNGLFWGFEEGVCASELLQLVESVAKPCLDRIQETAKRIKSHGMYRALNKIAKPAGGSKSFQSASLQARRGKKTSMAALPT